MIPYIKHNWGPYVLECRVEDDLIRTLLDEGNVSRENNLDYRDKLAGQIEEEYYYKDYGWFLSAFSSYVETYLEGVNGYTKTNHLGEEAVARQSKVVQEFQSNLKEKIEDLTEGIEVDPSLIAQQTVLSNGSWTLENLWINYQKANEYNPPHKHTGDLSFVIYLQVPDEIERENDLTAHEHKNEGAGMILFDYGMEMPLSINRIAHMPRTGDAFIFPAWLVHHVYAFKSDVERISVSGNIILR